MVNMIYAPIQLAEATGSPKPDESPNCPVKADFNGKSFSNIWSEMKHCDWQVQASLGSLLGFTIIGAIALILCIWHALTRN